MSKDKILSTPFDGRPTSASDILEASELIRSTLTLLRISSGVVFFAGQYTGSDKYSEDVIKGFAREFDALAVSLRSFYDDLIANYRAVSSKES